MTKTILRARPATWHVTASHMVELPPTLQANNLNHLREQLDQHARKYRSTPDKPPLGELTYRYETDSRDRVNLIHAYFTGRDGKLKRFARLER